ncbi:MAG: ribonuclease H-like domain-containing protein, partial [Candidatus Dormibacteria bacterium]
MSWASLGLSPADLSRPSLAPIGPAAATAGAGPVVGFDLETTGLRASAATVPFLYGWARIAASGVELEQWVLLDVGQEEPLVRAAHHQLRHSGLLLTYNGATFDLPLLRSRTVMTGVADPWPGTAHLDLLPVIRQLFGHRLPRCSLRSAEEQLLGLRRGADAAGSEAPKRFWSYVRSGDPTPLAPVLEHNRQDLLSLVRLLAHVRIHLEATAPRPSDCYSLGRHAEALGNLDQAGKLYRSALATAPAPLDRAAALRRARM